MNNSFYSEEDLRNIGFESLGQNNLISKNSSFYKPENIKIGNNVRIDDFCILSGNITIGSFVHISAFCALYGSNGIILEDYTGLSARTTIYSLIDDFSGENLVGPLVPQNFTKAYGGNVLVKKYSQIGASCIIFPNLIIGEGVAVGAFSLIKNSLEEWYIYAGIPVKKIKERKKDMLNKLTKNDF